MQTDNATLTERAEIASDIAQHDAIKWRAQWTLRKYNERDIALAGLDASSAQEDEIIAAGVKPYEVIEREGNLLMYGGASCIWECLMGNGTSTAGQTLTYFSNARAAIGVGDSSTAAAATQTDLQAATNKIRIAMDATYPNHTDGTSSGNASNQFKSTFTTTDANWAWQEWGVFNSSTAATGRMLNRKVESLGTKTSAASWAFTVTLSLA